MKEKIIAALKTKFQNLGFTDKAFEGVANFLVTTTTEETQIDNAVSGVESLLKAFQGDADSRVSKLKTENEELLKKVPKEEVKKEEVVTAPAGMSPEMVLMFEKLTESVGSLSTELKAIKDGKTGETRQSQIETLLKDANPLFKDIAMGNFEFVKDASPEVFQQFVEKVTAQNEAFTKTSNEQQLNNMPKGVYSNSKADGTGGKSTFAQTLSAAVDAKLAESQGKTV